MPVVKGRAAHAESYVTISMTYPRGTVQSPCSPKFALALATFREKWCA